MHICLIGNGLTNLILAKILVKKKINVDLFYSKSFIAKNSTRTISISNDNVNYLEKYFKNIKKIGWPTNTIKIYNETNNINKILDFNDMNSTKFYVFTNDNLFKFFNKETFKDKNIKKKKIKLQTCYQNIVSENKYDLIINSEKNNFFEKKYFSNKYQKNYNNFSYTSIISHKNINNHTARQIFTKHGPIAFLPISKSSTSIVFSVSANCKILSKVKFKSFIKRYNNYYKNISLKKLERFNLSFLLQRKYIYKNILNFGDNLHKIHPLAGQGFNMNVRNIRSLSKLIDQRIQLGMNIDESVIEKFENKNKHLNFIFASGIDLIHEFFQFNSLNPKYTNLLFKVLNQNKFFILNATKFADKGITI